MLTKLSSTLVATLVIAAVQQKQLQDPDLILTLKGTQGEI